MTLNEIAETLAERAGRQFSQPFQAEMKALVHVWRSRLVRDTLERNRKDRIFFRQWFEVEMEVIASMTEFPGFPVRPLMRSVCEIPNPLRANNIVFDYVGSLDGISQFQVFSEQHEIIPALNSPYTGDKIKILWMRRRLYAWNTLTLPGLLGSTVFDDVTAIDFLKCKCNQDMCYDDDKEYPAPREIQQKIIQAILSTELRVPTRQDDEVVEVTKDKESTNANSKA